ncbi:UNVERIFIED_CONTAM: DEAD/DEAH box helicase domain-containing protein [Hammondia hammondi]|eukprot:XP_008882210.1 DEAD/DEAH box helicase domain-containing protein [Hammondia hammondi]
MARRGTTSSRDPSREPSYLASHVWRSGEGHLLRGPSTLESACARGRRKQRRLGLSPADPRFLAHAASYCYSLFLPASPSCASAASSAFASSSPVQVCSASRSWGTEAWRRKHGGKQSEGRRLPHFSCPFCLLPQAHAVSSPPRFGEILETSHLPRRSRTCVLSFLSSLYVMRTSIASSTPASPSCLPPSSRCLSVSPCVGRTSKRTWGDAKTGLDTSFGNQPCLFPSFFFPRRFSSFCSASASPSSCDPLSPSSPAMPAECPFAAGREKDSSSSPSLPAGASSSSCELSLSSPTTAGPLVFASRSFLPSFLAPPFFRSLSPLASRWVACLSPLLQALPPPTLRLWGGSCCELKPLLLPAPLPLSVLLPHPLPMSVLSSAAVSSPSPASPSPVSSSRQPSSLLPPSVAVALHRHCGASAVSPLQQFLLPFLLSPSHDLFVLSRVQTGKSRAVQLAVVLRLLESDSIAQPSENELNAQADATRKLQGMEQGDAAFPKCLFLLPTRDTAIQAHAELLALLRYTPQLRVALLCGETAFYQAQQEAREERSASDRGQRAVADVAREDPQAAEWTGEPRSVCSRRGRAVNVFRRIEKLRAHIWICTPGKLDEYLGYLSWKDSFRNRATSRLTPTPIDKDTKAEAPATTEVTHEDTRQGRNRSFSRCTLLVVEDAAALLQQSDRGRQATAALLRLKERLPPGHQTIFLSSWLPPDLRSIFARLARVRSLTINALGTPFVSPVSLLHSDQASAQAVGAAPCPPLVSPVSHSASLPASGSTRLSRLCCSPRSVPLSPPCAASLSCTLSSAFLSPSPCVPRKDGDAEEELCPSQQTPETGENEEGHTAALLRQPSLCGSPHKETGPSVPRGPSLRESILDVEETAGLWGPKRASEFLAKKQRQWSELQSRRSRFHHSAQERRGSNGGREEEGIRRGEVVRSEFAIYPAELHAHVLFNVLMSEANRVAQLETEREGPHRRAKGQMAGSDQAREVSPEGRERTYRVIVFFSTLKSLQFHYVFFKHYVFPALLTLKTTDPATFSVLSAYPSVSSSSGSLSATHSFPLSVSSSSSSPSASSMFPPPPLVPARLPKLSALHHGLSIERRRAVVEAFSSSSLVPRWSPSEVDSAALAPSQFASGLPTSLGGQMSHRRLSKNGREREQGSLHGPEPPPQASSNRGHELRILFATDVAATGVNVGVVDSVIHVGMPRDPELLVQRLTRVARSSTQAFHFICLISVFLARRLVFTILHSLWCMSRLASI